MVGTVLRRTSVLAVAFLGIRMSNLLFCILPVLYAAVLFCVFSRDPRNVLYLLVQTVVGTRRSLRHTR